MELRLTQLNFIAELANSLLTLLTRFSFLDFPVVFLLFGRLFVCWCFRFCRCNRSEFRRSNRSLLVYRVPKRPWHRHHGGNIFILAWKPDGTIALAMFWWSYRHEQLRRSSGTCTSSYVFPRRCLQVVPCGLRVIRLNDTGD